MKRHDDAKAQVHDGPLQVDLSGCMSSAIMGVKGRKNKRDFSQELATV